MGYFVLKWVRIELFESNCSMVVSILSSHDPASGCHVIFRLKPENLRGEFSTTFRGGKVQGGIWHPGSLMVVSVSWSSEPILRFKATNRNGDFMATTNTDLELESLSYETYYVIQNPFWQFLGHELDHVTGKFIQQKFRSLSVFWKSGMGKTVSLKNSSIFG